MRKQLHGKLIALISLVLLLAACGFGAQEEEYVCEPPADSQWIATATPKSGNCPQDWVDLGKNELVGRTLIYEDEGLECGLNDLERTNGDYNCEVTIDEDPLVVDGQLEDDYVSFTVECPDGTTCFQGYDVEYFRDPDGSTNDDDDDSDDGGSEPTLDECRQQFDQQVVAAGDWAASSGACGCGEPCATQIAVFYQDGTYWKQWQQSDDLCDFDANLGGVHSSGTWEVIACGLLRIDTCYGEIWEVPYEIDSGILRINLPWKIGGDTYTPWIRMSAGDDRRRHAISTNSLCD